MQLPRRVCLFSLFLLVVPPLATAGAQAERPIRWTLERASEQAGSVGKDSVPFRLDAQIDKNWYLYAPSQPAAGPYAMEVRVDPGSGWLMLGDLKAPRPRRLPDRNFGIISEVFRGSSEFALTVQPMSAG